MVEADKPKSAREIWTDMINESYILTSDEERNMMSALNDDLIELALRSRSSISFMSELTKIDPDLKDLKFQKDIPQKYALMMQLINKRRNDQKIRKQK